MDIIGKKHIYFLISLLFLVPGVISLILFGLNLGIDFAGGSRIEYRIKNEDKGSVASLELAEVIRKKGFEVSSVQKSEENIYILRAKPLSQETLQLLTFSLQKDFKEVELLSFQTIGPSISKEITQNAFKSLLLASFLIVVFITFSFRKVPKPASSLRFGICAIIALLHDILVVVGIFSLLGRFFQVEVDSLFVTALLTIIGFSVHDTIVVFDRIRENLRRMPGVPFAKVANASVLQTFTRSLNTSLTTLLVLFTILLFGGETLKWFIVALLIGITSGTYSSIFTAAPLLVAWHDWNRDKISKP